MLNVCFIFFFSSRRRHTRLQGDWSSDVCSSDLVNGFGEAIDPQTFPTAGTVAGTANLAAQIQIDHSSCSSRGNLYQLFVAPDNALENAAGQPMRSAYVGVSIDAKLGLPAFIDRKS